MKIKPNIYFGKNSENMEKIAVKSFPRICSTGLPFNCTSRHSNILFYTTQHEWCVKLERGNE